MSLDESHSATNGGSASLHDNLARAPVQDLNTIPSKNGSGLSNDETFIGDDVDDHSETHELPGGQSIDDTDALPRGEPQACLFVAR